MAEAIDKIKKVAAQAQAARPSRATSAPSDDVDRSRASAFPEIDVLVNNVGTYEPKPFEKITDEDWQKIIETNFFSGLRLSRAYLPIMLNHNWGRIIFISSESAVQIPMEMIHYGVTKTMQLALARGLAETTMGTGVTVNSVLPGPTRSEGVEGFVKNMAKEQGKSAGRRREGLLQGRAARARSSSASPPTRKSRTWSPTSPARSPPPPTAPRCASMAAWCGRSCRAAARTKTAPG